MCKYTEDELREFIVEAKVNTYAGQGNSTDSSRKNSLDLPYEKGSFNYLDSYLGSRDFAGEEIVWHEDIPVWGMNYYGKVLPETAPEGFGEFLKKALSMVEKSNPYRGIEYFRLDGFEYFCNIDGELDDFSGKESISFGGKTIYKLYFHGGGLK